VLIRNYINIERS